MPRALLVTGASGYLGSELVRRAPAYGWRAVAAVHRTPPAAGAETTELDLCDAGATAARVEELAPAAVINAAYVQDGPGLWPVTHAGAVAVARGAAAAGARLVQVSTDVVFAGDRPPPERYDEDDEPRPVTEYGRAKLAAERDVAGVLPQALVVRTSLLYGGVTPGPQERAVIDALDGRSDTAFFTDEIRCPIAVGELAGALLRLLDLTAAGVLHVAGEQAMSRYAFAALLAGQLGRDPAPLRAARVAGGRAVRPRNCALSVTRAASVLGAAPRAGPGAPEHDPR